MRAAVASLLALAGLAVAAPVPKSITMKIEDVFGEITDPKGACKFEMKKDGALTITVPTDHPVGQPGAGLLSPALAGKTLDGDFSLSVRITPHLPTEVTKREGTSSPQLMAGVAVLSTENPKRIGVNAGTVRQFDNGDWVQKRYCDYRHLKINGLANLRAKPERVPTATHLRVTKRGDQVLVEMSAEGTKWVQVISKTLVGFTGAVHVGPVVYGCIDKEFSVTFDQYELKPLTEEKK